MKTLLLVRHAKSSWANELLPDKDRPLNTRGKHDAPLMGQILREQEFLPDLLLSSVAKRALSTAKLLAGEVGYAKNNIRTDEALYHASPETIIRTLQHVDTGVQSVLLVGHNPGLTEAVPLLCQFAVDNVPTCGIVRIDFLTDTWADISVTNGLFRWFDYPKKHR